MKKRSTADYVMFTAVGVGIVAIVLSLALFLLAPHAFIRGFKKGLSTSPQSISKEIKRPQIQDDGSENTAYWVIGSQLQHCWQIREHWVQPEIAPIWIAEFDKNGMVHKATLHRTQNELMETNPVFGNFAKDALEGITRSDCLPLKQLPKAPHSTWQKVELEFLHTVTVRKAQPINHKPSGRDVENSIREQIMKCWNYHNNPAEPMKVHVQVLFSEDGSITDSRIKTSDTIRYTQDARYKQFADSALRATRNPHCVPLKGLPVDSYESWRKIELVFDTEAMW